jgi:hypothetical protein
MRVVSALTFHSLRREGAEAASLERRRFVRLRGTDRGFAARSASSRRLSGPATPAGVRSRLLRQLIAARRHVLVGRRHPEGSVLLRRRARSPARIVSRSESSEAPVGVMWTSLATQSPITQMSLWWRAQD